MYLHSIHSIVCTLASNIIAPNMHFLQYIHNAILHFSDELGTDLALIGY